MTKLNKTVVRETPKLIQGRPIIVSLIPVPGISDAMISLRPKGTRFAYRGTVADIYRVLAQWHGAAEARARREARKQGIPWRVAKKAFCRA